MDEEEFLDILAGAFDKINKKLDSIILKLKVQQFVQQKLADVSKEQPRESSGKPMPEIIGEYTIAAKGCNRCGGKITWDLYDKESGHGYPDHVDTDGNLIDCPEY